MRKFLKAYEIVYISSLDLAARFINDPGQFNKVPGSVPEKQRTPISGTQLGKAITSELLDQMIPKFKLQLVHKVYNNFYLDKSSIKPSYHQAHI